MLNTNIIIMNLALDSVSIEKMLLKMSLVMSLEKHQKELMN